MNSTPELLKSRPAKRTHIVKPVDDMRFDDSGHWPEHAAEKHRCSLCKVAKSRVRCIKCNFALCLTKDKNHFEITTNMGIGIQYVHYVMHKCIMVKVGGNEKHIRYVKNT